MQKEADFQLLLQLWGYETQRLTCLGPKLWGPWLFGLASIHLLNQLMEHLQQACMMVMCQALYFRWLQSYR
jgi:hypothetical protein